ncbi:MAG: type II toxin-antitoxin system VapC family toxin [bacterium]|nr:type II toxin-antitoxin system VapC family toxin [bacterium]
MTLFVLDSDHVSLFQRNHPQVVQRVRAVPPQNLAVTVVTVEEQMRGWLNAIRRASSGSALTSAYTHLRAALEYFQTVQLLDFDSTAHRRYLRLREQKIRIGTQDLRIAATTLTGGGVLVTGNARDFSQVPGLTIEDWSSR